MLDESIVPSTQRPSVLYWRLSDFKAWGNFVLSCTKLLEKHKKVVGFRLLKLRNREMDFFETVQWGNMTFDRNYSLVGILKSGKEVVAVSLVKEGIFVGRRLLFVFFNLRNGNSKKTHSILCLCDISRWHFDDVHGKNLKVWMQRGIHIINVYFDEDLTKGCRIKQKLPIVCTNLHWVGKCCLSRTESANF